MTGRAGFRLLAHTADIGLEASAPTQAELFVAAAKGLTTLLFDGSPVVTAIHKEVCLEAPDDAALLVTWLNEILCFIEIDHLVPATFEIAELGGGKLVAVIGGEPYDTARHLVERTAKAVTYHRLVVEKRQKGWYARVYIDL